MQRIHRDQLVEIFGYLEPSQLCRCMAVSHLFEACANVDILWEAACDRVWQNKVYIPRKAKDLFLQKQRKEAFKFSLLDSNRTTITVDEITELEWYFRFKYDAGEIWIHNDPFWHGGEARRVRFCRDKTVYFEVNTNQRMNWSMLKYRDLAPHYPDEKFPPDDLTEGWPVIQVEDFPPKTVLRHPENWGFILHSTWVVYTSFKMTARNIDKYTRDHRLTRQLFDWQWIAAGEYNEGLVVED